MAWRKFWFNKLKKLYVGTIENSCQRSKIKSLPKISYTTAYLLGINIVVDEITVDGSLLSSILSDEKFLRIVIRLSMVWHVKHRGRTRGYVLSLLLGSRCYINKLSLKKWCDMRGALFLNTYRWRGQIPQVEILFPLPPTPPVFNLDLDLTCMRLELRVGNWVGDSDVSTGLGLLSSILFLMHCIYLLADIGGYLFLYTAAKLGWGSAAAVAVAVREGFTAATVPASK